MVTGYNGSPSAGVYDGDHKYLENLSITLTNKKNTFDDVPISKPQNITIKDVITGIAIDTLPNDLAFGYNETFKCTNGKIKTVYRSGAKGDTIYMNAAGVTLTENDGSTNPITTTAASSAFNNGIANKKVKVNYTKDGKTYSTTYDITIEDSITGIDISGYKQEFNHGEAFSPGNGIVTVHYSVGADKEIPMSRADVSITQKDTTNAPNTSPSSYGTDNTTKQKLEVSYEDFTKEYEITITNNITGIAMKTEPKTQYNVNDTEDLNVPGTSDKAQIEITRANKEKTQIDIDAEGVTRTGFDTSQEHTAGKTITVSYQGHNTSYTIFVTDSVNSIRLNKNPEEIVKHKEDINLEGIKIIPTKGSGDAEPVTLTKSMIYEPDGTTLFDNTKLGPRTLIVKYGGKETTFDVDVKDHITAVKFTPVAVNGILGDTLNDIITNNSISYILEYSSGHKANSVNVTMDMINASNTFDSNVTSTQMLPIDCKDLKTDSITYNANKTAEIPVTLKNVLDRIEITPPTKTEYLHGESIDFTGSKIELINKDGTPAGTVTMTSSMISETGNAYGSYSMSPEITEFPYVSGSSSERQHTMTKTLNIKYKDPETNKEGTATYTITIINDVTSIELMPDTITKLEKDYSVGDTLSLDIADGVKGDLKLNRKVGNPEIIKLDAQGVSVSSMVNDRDYRNQPITVTYVESYTHPENTVTKTTKFYVNVIDEVTKIEVSDPTTTEYRYGTPNLDLSGAVITPYKGSVAQTTVPLSSIPEGDIQGYKPKELGEQTITVSYGGQTATFKITVKDYVEDIAFTPSDTITGTYNDTIDTILANCPTSYKVKYASKESYETPALITKEMIANGGGNPYNPETTAEQTLTIKYHDTKVDSIKNGQDIPANFKVKLSDALKAIEITAPSQITYNHGEDIKRTGGLVTLKYQVASDDTNSVSIDAATFKYENGIIAEKAAALNYDSTTHKGTRTITITYTDPETGIQGTKDYEITVTNTIESIKMYTYPKQNYKVGDTSLDLNVPGTTTKAEILVKRADGTSEAIPIDRATLTYDLSTEGKATVEVKYNENGIEKQTSFEVDVVGRDKIDSITFSPSTISGDIGDTLDDILNDNNITYTVNYKTAGSGTPVIITKEMIINKDDFDPESPNPQTMKIKYRDTNENSETYGTDVEVSFIITLVDGIKSVKLIQEPDKLDYKYGQAIEVIGGLLEVETNSGTKETIPLEQNMISGYNPSELGEQTIKIKYNGEFIEDTFKVNVEDYVKGLKIIAPDKTAYEIGEELELAGGKVQVMMASGKVLEEVELDAEEVTLSEFDPELQGLQVIKVIYKEMEGNFEVTVSDVIIGIELVTPPDKTTYEYGENLLTDGAALKITTKSGSITIPVIYEMCSGYNASSPGTQTITVTYEGFKDTFKVNVKEKEKEPEPEKPEPETPKPNPKPNPAPTPKPTPTKPVEEKPKFDGLDSDPIIQVIDKDTGGTIYTPIQQEKPTAVLGVKDKKKDPLKDSTLIPIIIGGIRSIFLTITCSI